MAGTRFDFRTARRAGPGFDHNYVLDKGVTAEPVDVAELHDPATGRHLTLATTEPGVQLYTADHFDADLGFAPGDGIALETQHFPDSPNQPSPVHGPAAGRDLSVPDGVRVLGAVTPTTRAVVRSARCP
ncbi:hypothetical protein SALBM135S_06798 [Streptomyces alboniger]